VQVLFRVLLANLKEADCRPVCEVVLLIYVYIKVRLNLYILGVEIVVSVDVVNVVILSVSGKDARKNCIELARADLNVVTDV
jgi:hypothetical protein